MCITPPVTALARSASSRMMFGDLPPSSWLTRLTVGAARLATSMPARVEPVNEIMSMSGCSLMAAPTSGPRPLTRLNTPLGTPASCRISAKISADDGVNSDGFRIMVQPAASAGATLQAIWFSGQFHGVIMPMTPTGSRTTIGGAERLLEMIVLQHVERGDDVAEAGAGLHLLRHRQRRAHLVGDGGADILHAGLVDLDDLGRAARRAPRGWSAKRSRRRAWRRPPPCRRRPWSRAQPHTSPLRSPD